MGWELAAHLSPFILIEGMGPLPLFGRLATSARWDPPAKPLPAGQKWKPFGRFEVLRTGILRIRSR